MALFRFRNAQNDEMPRVSAFMDPTQMREYARAWKMRNRIGATPEEAGGLVEGYKPGYGRASSQQVKDQAQRDSFFTTNGVTRNKRLFDAMNVFKAPQNPVPKAPQPITQNQGIKSPDQLRAIVQSLKPGEQFTANVPNGQVGVRFVNPTVSAYAQAPIDMPPNIAPINPADVPGMAPKPELPEELKPKITPEQKAAIEAEDERRKTASLSKLNPYA